jgi:hypothetical protein
MAKIQEATELLMPKATAMWFIENTVLTFDQIADFTGLHNIEVQALADGEVGRGIVGRDPVSHFEIEKEEIEKAEKDSDYRMKRFRRRDLPTVKVRSKGPKYTPVSKRGDKPDAIAWLVKNHPEVTDAQIVKLIGTTKPTIKAIRERSHANISNIRPRHPAELSLCSYQELEAVLKKAMKAAGKDPDDVDVTKHSMTETENESSEDQGEEGKGAFAGFDFSNFIKTSN